MMSLGALYGLAGTLAALLLAGIVYALIRAEDF